MARRGCCTEGPVFKSWVVGLTASIGVDNAVSVDQAKENILQICGNLDVEHVSCVESHVEELKKEVHLSEEELIELSEQPMDDAVLRILNKMKTLETHMAGLAKKLKKRELTELMTHIPAHRKSIQYGHWAVKVKNIAMSLPRTESTETNGWKRSLIILADYLSTYNVALELHDLVLLRHVMTFLKKCFDQYKENKNCTDDENFYFESFSELEEAMRDKLDSENTNLTLLKKCLLKYLIAKGGASRGIIFVRTRALVSAVTSWLNHCGDGRIEDLKATAFTGTSAPAAQGGMTTAQQNEAIQLFKTGQVRLLVATSVAEEGIDIPECNLVIRYNYVGNEITTVQTRGRSRKKGGMSVILAMSKIIQKEKLNQEKAKMMEGAIEQIRQMESSEIHKKIKAHQQKILRDEEVNEFKKKQMKHNLRREHFKMVCQLCGNVTIDSDDIRTVCQTHHVVINWNIFYQTKTDPQADVKTFDDIRLIGPVKCMGKLKGGKYCNSKLGSLMIFSNVPYVVLGIKSFGFEVGDQTKLKPYRNWKFVPYIIDEIGPEDSERYLPEPSTISENNDQIYGSKNQPLERRNGAMLNDKRSFSMLQFYLKQPANTEQTSQDTEHTTALQNRVRAEFSRPEGLPVLGGDREQLLHMLRHCPSLESKFSSVRLPLLSSELPSLQVSLDSCSGSQESSSMQSYSEADAMEEMSKDLVENEHSPSAVEAHTKMEDLADTGDTHTKMEDLTDTGDTHTKMEDLAATDDSLSLADTITKMVGLAEITDDIHTKMEDLADTDDIHTKVEDLADTDDSLSSADTITKMEGLAEITDNLSYLDAVSTVEDSTLFD